MTPSPRELLAQALDAYGDIERHAHKAGVSPKDFLNAQTGRPCPTIPFLRICVAIQHDPLPSIPYQMPEKPSDFDFLLLSIALRMHRGLTGQSRAQIAKALDVSPVTVRRIEEGKSSLVGVILRACTMIGLHPFGFLTVTDTPCRSSRDNVSRETSAVGDRVRSSGAGALS